MAMMITMALAMVGILAMMSAMLSVFGAVILANASEIRVVEKKGETLSNRCPNHPAAEMGAFQYH